MARYLRCAIVSVLFCSMFVWPNIARADPITGDWVNVSSLRSFANANVIFVVVTSAALCGTDTFQIDISSASGKAAYASLLAALLSARQVRVELLACAGWGTPLSSIYLK